MNSDFEAGIPSLYIHWPYCQRKCPYCDFNVHLAKREIDEAIWVSALLRDLAWQLEGMKLAPLQTIYFGGGTPSLLSPQSIDALITGALRLWPKADAPQVTLEVHPTSADQAKFADFQAAGVNRVSIGVQSFDDKALKFLGRDHSSEEALRAVEAAQRQFGSVSLDLITALPGMDVAAQAHQIDQALDLGVGHLSVYQLGIEPGTAFGQAVQRGDWTPADADAAADLFLAAADQICAAGFDHYEVSNFAKPGAQSQHSVLGWQGHGYVGLGPGAEGRVLDRGNIWRQRLTARNPAEFLDQIAERGHGLSADVALSAEDRALEQLIFGLRLSDGLPLSARAWAATQPARWQALIKSGDLEETSTHRRATAQGRLRLDALTDYLVNYAR